MISADQVTSREEGQRQSDTGYSPARTTFRSALDLIALDDTLGKDLIAVYLAFLRKTVELCGKIVDPVQNGFFISRCIHLPGFRVERRLNF